MAKVFLLLNNDENKENIKQKLLQNRFEITEIDSEAGVELDDIISRINNESPDIILIDSNFQNSKYFTRQIKTDLKTNAQVILLLENTEDIEFMKLGDALIKYPIDYEILSSTIESHLKTKKSLDRLYENNKELSRSLYQLNVLYNTSSQFAGTLNTKKLYDIMIEAMEKTLSFDISSVMIFNSLNKPVFFLNTMHLPADNLVNALKIRSILNFDSMNETIKSHSDTDFSQVEIIQKTKQERSNRIFGIEAISFDSLYAPIKVGEEFFGVVELFRQTPFSSEDVTCFQAIAHQVALPLRSAKLYEEISITNKKLEKLEKLKSEFVSIVSHELRTPLTPISNSLEIVLSNQAGEISEDARNFILMAKRNIQRLSGIIEDLLDLSRIQTGKLDFRYKTVNITSSLELLLKTFYQSAEEKNINISLDIKENLPDIYADLRRIEQIFTNLVSNSLKFTSSNGKIDIQASVVNACDMETDKIVSPKTKLSGNYIKVSVSDTGIGMNEEDIPKIFDKFSQIESSLNRNTGGVGLGLTITKQLIDAHLGLIAVTSKEHEGSVFTVYIPVLDEFKVFIMNLSRALINNEVGVFKILYKNSDSDLIDTLKEQKIINTGK
ncbi:MAG: hypothetical protein IKR34_03085, partial [Candidatus Gastranaerophilales bacterium]|nr:hypothetical protein [Candidatus Gastranaerophilales bacterium]